MADANDSVTPGTPTDITALPGGTVPVSAPAADAITPQAAAGETHIQLPPRPRHQPLPPESFQRVLTSLDTVLLGLCLLLAFAVAAFPVRNTDVLMHLATGRALVEGKYNPVTATDPFAHTTEGVRWVNHSWLYDLLTYAENAAFGIPGLIVLKALLIALLAYVLVRAGRSERGLWLPVLGATLAVLALSPRLLLQPICASFLFLGVTLWLLQRGGHWLYAPAAEEPGRRRATPGEPVTWKNYWPLLPLFALWANLDEWFFLGPLTVGLYALGQAIQARQTATRVTAETPRPGEVRALTQTFLFGLAACLLNPHHVFVFALPAQLGLSGVSTTLKEDSVLRVLFYSPFRGEYFRANNISVAGLVYFLLLVLGLLSFAINYRHLRWARLLPFALFLVLSALNARSVPFFAVVAGPLLALNVQDAVRRAASAARPRRAPRQGLVAGRVLSIVVLLGLLAVAWPGWLQARPYERRRVALTDELDPSLRKAALWIKEQRASGSLPADARAFNFSPDIVNALAWYCPEEKGFFDFRYHLFATAAEDYVNVRRGLSTAPSGPQAADRPKWQEILDRRKVDHVILYDPEPLALSMPLFLLWSEPLGKDDKDWALLYADGRTAVFGWLKARPAYKKLGVDTDKLVYAPAEDQKAPPEGMQRLPAPRPFYEAYVAPLPPRSLESDEAAMDLIHFDVLAQSDQRRHTLDAWNFALAAQMATGVNVTGGPNLVPPLLGPAAVAMPFLKLVERSRPAKAAGQRGRGAVPALEQRLEKQVDFLFGVFQNLRDAGPPELLMLAARACRRGLAHNPDDALGLARLGGAYYLFKKRTRERFWAAQMRWIDEDKRLATGDLAPQPAGGLTPLSQLRHVQAVSALSLAVLLQPDLESVHSQLADLYGVLGYPDRDGVHHHGYKDVELKHRQAELRAARARPQPGETEEHHGERLKAYQERVDELEKYVAKMSDRFENMKHRLPTVLNKAERAFDLGLGGKALDILLDSNAAAFGEQGVRLQIELALNTGRVRDLRKWFDEAEGNLRGPLGPFLFPWYSALLAAATGDYATADKYLKEVAALSHQTYQLNMMLRHNAQLGVVLDPKKNPAALNVPRAISLLVSKAVLDAPLPVAGKWLTTVPTELMRTPASTLWIGLSEEERNRILFMFSRQCLGFALEEAQVHALRGLLAVEWGEPKKAARAFRAARAQLSAFSQTRLPVRILTDEYLQKLARQ